MFGRVNVINVVDLNIDVSTPRVSEFTYQIIKQTKGCGIHVECQHDADTFHSPFIHYFYTVILGKRNHNTAYIQILYISQYNYLHWYI